MAHRCARLLRCRARESGNRAAAAGVELRSAGPLGRFRDELAVAAAKQKDLLIDSVFEMESAKTNLF